MIIPAQDRSPITEEELRERWPEAFNDLRYPLKIGINSDMGIKHSDTMARWTRHPRYLRNLIERENRIDLNGEVAEAVTEEAKMMACERLDWVRRTIKLARYDRRADRYSSPRPPEMSRAEHLLWMYPTGLSPAEESAELRLRMPKGSAKRLRAAKLAEPWQRIK